MKYTLSLIFSMFYAVSAYGLTPPSNATLCDIQGEILALTEQEATNPQMNQHFMVPVVIVEVYNSAPQDINYSGEFCNIPIPTQDSHFSGMKNAGYYRICQEGLAPLKADQHIKAVMGRSLGGGPYCIENIQVLSE